MMDRGLKVNFECATRGDYGVTAAEANGQMKNWNEQ